MFVRSGRRQVYGGLSRTTRGQVPARFGQNVAKHKHAVRDGDATSRYGVTTAV